LAVGAVRIGLVVLAATALVACADVQAPTSSVGEPSEAAATTSMALLDRIADDDQTKQVERAVKD